MKQAVCGAARRNVTTRLIDLHVGAENKLRKGKDQNFYIR